MFAKKFVQLVDSLLIIFDVREENDENFSLVLVDLINLMRETARIADVQTRLTSFAIGREEPAEIVEKLVATFALNALRRVERQIAPRNVLIPAEIIVQ